jgi:hypothetical protein
MGDPDSELSREGVGGKKYTSPPLGPSNPMRVGDDGVSSPVALWRLSVESPTVARTGVGAWIVVVGWWCEDEGRDDGYTNPAEKGMEGKKPEDGLSSTGVARPPPGGWLTNWPR